jgi:hypothetical protein
MLNDKAKTENPIPDLQLDHNFAAGPQLLHYGFEKSVIVIHD